MVPVWWNPRPNLHAMGDIVMWEISGYLSQHPLRMGWRAFSGQWYWKRGFITSSFPDWNIVPLLFLQCGYFQLQWVDFDWEYIAVQAFSPNFFKAFKKTLANLDWPLLADLDAQGDSSLKCCRVCVLWWVWETIVIFLDLFVGAVVARKGQIMDQIKS